MSEPVETEMVFVKEEFGGVDVKKEPDEEQDPLSIAKDYIGNKHKYGNKQLKTFK